MTIDLVFPKNNEKSLIEMAKRLGYSSLCLIYKDKKELKKQRSKISSENIELYFGLKDKQGDFSVFSTNKQNDLEKKKIDLIYNIENIYNKDSTHFRKSGLNQVLCKIMSRKSIIYGISFASILKKDHLILGRIIQNIRFCRKYRVKIALASFADNPYKMRYYHDMIALGIVLGLHPSESKNSLKVIETKIKNKLLKRSERYISEGVELLD